MAEARNEHHRIVALSRIQYRYPALGAPVAGLKIDRMIGGNNKVGRFVISGVGEQECGTPAGDGMAICHLDIGLEAVGYIKCGIEDRGGCIEYVHRGVVLIV